MRAVVRLGAVLLAALAAGTDSPIHFRYQPVDFRLDTCETPERHVPETMAGGVAVFDYNSDGYLDIFFTNGADIRTLKKTSPKYSNRLFANDGKGRFTDVTQKAGLAGSGLRQRAPRSATTTTTATRTSSSAASMATRCTTTTGMARSPM